MNHYVQPKSVPQTDGPYSQIVVDGQYAHFSGLVAADLADAQAVLGDMGKETRAVMSAIQSMLAELDLDMGHIVRVDVHITSFDDSKAMNAVYAEFFPIGQCPARTTTVSAGLYGGSLVEITCMAKLD